METQTSQLGAVVANAIIMIGVLVACLVGYTLATLQTEVAVLTWVRTNRLRFVLSFLLIGILSGLIEYVPDLGPLFLFLGFAVDKSPVALGLAIAFLLIGVTSAPAKGPNV